MWLSFAFLSAILLGLYDVFKKRSLNDNAVIPVLFINTLACTLIFLPFIIASANHIIAEDSPYFIPAGDFETHRYIFLKAVIVLASWIFGYFGIKHLPLTIVGPINATRPVMVLLGALLVFNESLNIWQWIGVVLAIISFFLLSMSGRKEGIRFSHNKAIWLVVLAAILGAVSGLYDKFILTSQEQGGMGINRMMMQGWFNLYQCVLMLIILFALWLPLRHRTTPFQWRWSIVMISIFLTLADFVYFYALSLPDAMISIISMVRRSSVLISFIFGAIMFHEKNLKAKAVDLALVIISMMFLALGTYL